MQMIPVIFRSIFSTHLLTVLTNGAMICPEQGNREKPFYCSEEHIDRIHCKGGRKMLYPSIFNDNLFDDLMNLDFPRFVPAGNAERKLYGKQTPAIMKTDVLEHEDHYEVNIDLPGFKKEEISLELDNGNLTVSTSRNVNEEEKNEEGKGTKKARSSVRSVTWAQCREASMLANTSQKKTSRPASRTAF